MRVQADLVSGESPLSSSYIYMKINGYHFTIASHGRRGNGSLFHKVSALMT